MANELLKQINDIKSTISTNDQIVWACQASSKCYADEITKIKIEEDLLTKDIAKIDEEIKESEQSVVILENCVKMQNETMKTSLESLVTHRLYQKCLEEKLAKHKKDCALVLEEYCDHIEQCKTNLEQSNPLFKTLQEKKIELKKSRINNLILQRKIRSRKEINAQKLEIRKKIFYAEIVAFAEAWLNQKKMLEAQEEYERVKQQERELIIKLMELTEESRTKDKLGYASRDNVFIPQIQFSKSSIEAVPSKKEKTTANIPSNGNSMNPFNDLEALLKETNFAPSERRKKIENNNALPDRIDLSHKEHCTPAKVRVLENKTLKPAYVSQPVETLSKEERSKAIDAKLQKVMRNFHRPMSRQSSQKLSKQDILEKSFSETLGNAKSSVDKNKIPSEEMTKSQTGVTQGLENLNILSQETRVAMNILSQDSDTGNSAEAKLKKFKYFTTDNSNVANKSKVENNIGKGPDCGNKTVRFQKMDIDNGNIHLKNKHLEKKEIPKQEKMGMIKTDPFKMNNGNAFRKNGEFSMNLGKHPFQSSVKESSESNVHPSQTSGSNGIFQPLAKPLGFSQPFKMNGNNENSQTSNVFKVPETAASDNFPSQNTVESSNSIFSANSKDSQKPPPNEEHNFFNIHGTQYNFGAALTQITDNPDESYDVAWSPPTTDFSNASPMDTNNLLPFQQSTSNFGFSFFK